MAYGDSRVAVGSLLIRSGPVLALLLLAALLQLALPLFACRSPWALWRRRPVCAGDIGAVCRSDLLGNVCACGMLEVVLRLS
jgi:hypothetical protein